MRRLYLSFIAPVSFPKLISRAVNLISGNIEMGESMVGFVLKMGRIHQKWRSTVVTIWKEDDDLG